MTFDTDDPRLTAYALGELDPDSHREVEELLASSDEARRYIEEIRQTASWLTEELQKETVLPLPRPDHELIEQKLQEQPVVSAILPWWRRNLRLMSVAATLLAGATVGLVSWKAVENRNRRELLGFEPAAPAALAAPRAALRRKLSPDAPKTNEALASESAVKLGVDSREQRDLLTVKEECSGSSLR